MGLEKSGDMVELTDSKKELVDFIRNGEKGIHEIRKKIGVTDRYVKMMIAELNECGVVAYHNDEHGVTKYFIRDIKIKHETDKFIPDAVMVAGIILITSIVSLYVLFSLKFLAGAIVSIIPIFALTLYRILRTPDLKHYFYKKISGDADKKLIMETIRKDINNKVSRKKTIKKIVEDKLCNERKAYRLYNRILTSKNDKPTY